MWRFFNLVNSLELHLSYCQFNFHTTYETCFDYGGNIFLYLPLLSRHLTVVLAGRGPTLHDQHHRPAQTLMRA